MATDTNLIAAIDAIINKANTLASNGDAEQLVYLAKALETVGPASTIRHLVQIGESERARVISTGDTKVQEVQTADKEGGAKSCQVFTSSGTWTRPSGVTRLRVQLVGGGGGSSGHSENGGAGGYSEKIIDVTSISSVSVTVGSGGSKSNYGSNAGSGGTTSFGSYLSATGGTGGHHSNHSGGRGGQGSGGDINLRGGGGSGHTGESSTSAASYFGGGAPGAHHDAGDWYASGSNGAPGAGGAGQWTSHHNRNVTGMAGIIIVWEYE